MPKIAGEPMETIAVRLPPAEAAALRERAHAAGIAHSALLRMAWRCRPEVDLEEREALRRTLDNLVRIGGNLNQLSHHCNQTHRSPTLDEILAIRDVLVPALEAVRGALQP